MVLCFGERLKNLRLMRGLSQEQLALQLGVNRSVISLYESNQRMPSFDILLAISRIFHVSTDFLLGARGFEVPQLIVDTTGLPKEDVDSLSAIFGVIIEEYKKKTNRHDGTNGS